MLHLFDWKGGSYKEEVLAKHIAMHPVTHVFTSPQKCLHVKLDAETPYTRLCGLDDCKYTTASCVAVMVLHGLTHQ